VLDSRNQKRIVRAFATKPRTTTDTTMKLRMQNIAGFLLPDALRAGADRRACATYRPWSKDVLLPA
jgi:hypothetical protein